MAYDASSSWWGFLGRKINKAYLQVTTKTGDGNPGGAQDQGNIATGIAYAEVVALTDGVADHAPLGSAANPLNVTGGGGGGGSISPAIHAQTAALAASLVASAVAQVLYAFEVNVDATISAADWWVLIFDAATLPANGAQTPTKAYQQPAGSTQSGATFGAGGVQFTTGIVLAVSTTGPFNLTAGGNHAFLAADIG